MGIERSLKDYEEIYGRPTPIRYDILHFSDEHRRLDALLRRHWDDAHPLVRDLFTSFALEFEYLLELKNKAEEELQEFKSEYDEKRNQLDDELDDRLVELRKQITILENFKEGVDQREKKLRDEIAQLTQANREKDALIVTQRRELDNMIDNKTQFEKKRQNQEDTISASIESVYKVTSELEKLEEDTVVLEQQNLEYRREINSLKENLEETENQYITEIDEINSLYSALKEEITELKVHIEQVETKNQNLSEENSRLEAKLRAIEKAGKQIDQIRRENLAKEELIEELRLRNSKLQNLSKELLARHEEIKKEINKRKKTRPKSSSDQPTYVFKPRVKTSLEAELERETTDTPADVVLEEKETVDQGTIEEISSITSKFEQSEQTKEILEAMKSAKPKTEVIKTDFSQDFKLQPVRDEELSSNLKRMFAQSDLGIKDILETMAEPEKEFLADFVEEFPSPPKNRPTQHAEKQKKNDPSHRQKMTS